MHTYRSPPRSPVTSRPQSRSSSWSRSRSRSRSPSPRPKSRSKSKYRNGDARSRSRARSKGGRGRSRSSSSSRSRSSSPARSKSKSRKYYSGRANEDKIDVSKSSVAKTSAVFLGSVAVATICAHKFWPKGFIYGDKEDWELRKKEKKAAEKAKKVLKEGEQKVDDFRRGDRNDGGAITTASAGQSSREVVYRDQQRPGHRGDLRSNGTGANGGVVVRTQEEEALVYRDDRKNGRNGVVVRSRGEEEVVAYPGRDDRNRGRGPTTPRLALPADEGVVYERTTRLTRGRERDRERGREVEYDRHLGVDEGPRQGRSVTRPPSPTSTTMAVAGSPVRATEFRRQQLQTQRERDRRDDEYYLLPAAPSLGRSSSFHSAGTSSPLRDLERDRDYYRGGTRARARSPSLERSYVKTTTTTVPTLRPSQSSSAAASTTTKSKKYYYEDELPRTRTRGEDTAYIYRDRETAREPPPPPQTRSSKPSRSGVVMVEGDGPFSSSASRGATGRRKSRYDDERDIRIVDAYYDYR